MVRGKNRFSTIFLALVIAGTLMVGVSGLPHMGMTMSMDEHGNMTMSDCYMPGMTAICNMTPLEHAGAWLSMFVGTLTSNAVFVLFLLLLGVVASITWIRQAHSPPDLREQFRFTRRREYVPLATQLQELFSSGILNPKTF